jgi:hypothetical protein
MAKPLDAAGELLERLLLPASLLQFAVIAASIALGWWIARLLRAAPHGPVAPDDLRSRAREPPGWCRRMRSSC